MRDVALDEWLSNLSRRAGIVAGCVAAAAIPGLILATGAAVVLSADASRGLSVADWAAIRFTVVQAILSALFSVALAVPVARALARRVFRPDPLVSLLGAPFLLPTIVAIFDFSPSSDEAAPERDSGSFGVAPVSIYGLTGVVRARLLQSTSCHAPGPAGLARHGGTLSTCRLLDMDGGAVFRNLELPMLKGAALGRFLLFS